MNLGMDKRPHGPPSPEIVNIVRKLRAKYGNYAIPDDRSRELVDNAMRAKTLSDEMRAMREG